MFKKYWLSALLVLCVVPFTFAFAITSEQGNNVSLPAGQTVTDTVFLAGNNVTVDSNISGDLFVFGQNIYVNGNVDGDVIGAGQSVIINGNVSGNIRFVGQTINLNGSIGRAASLAGQSLNLGNGAIVGRDLMAAGQDINLNGTVNGSANVAGMTLNVNGKVLKNVNFYSNENTSTNGGLFVAQNAAISGNVNYHAFGDVKGATQTNILGEIIKKAPQVKAKPSAQVGILAALGFLATLLLTVLVLVLVGGKKVKDVNKIMAAKAWQAFGLGFAILILSPILAFIFLVTGFGAWIGSILLLIWVLILALAFLFASIGFGQYLGRVVIKKEYKQKFLIDSLIGAIVGYILVVIPFIGFFVGFFGMCWGMGGMFLSFLESRKEVAKI